MRRLTLTSALALVALAALAATASAASKTPVISSFSPSQVRVGQTLVINGKNFKKGVKNNRVFFKRASDGKTVRARPSKANSSRRLEVVVPADISPFLELTNGVAGPTRFQIQILSGRFSKTTSKSKSPIILPAGSVTNPGTGGGTTGVGAPPPADCDSDGTPDSVDTDDDNDGLSDDLEAQIHTDPCKKDTDGDGVEDGFEYWSAIDLNSSAVPYPGKRPYPNALDATDAKIDFDGDGLTSEQEFQAWNLYGGRVLPSGPGQTFPYSAGNQDSPAAVNAGGRDYDTNGRISDDEKDADNDGLANWVELAEGGTADPALIAFGSWTNANGTVCPYGNAGANKRYQDCTQGVVPNGNTFTDGSYPGYFKPDWLDPDSDGDGINDSADDQDHDDLSNATEIANQTNPVNPCDPSVEARTCPEH